MIRGSSHTARRAALLAVAIALAAAASAALARLAGRTSAGDSSARDTYTCHCGTTYRVSGTDRHRVYWTADAPEDAPVLGDRCVECDASFPRARA